VKSEKLGRLENFKIGKIEKLNQSRERGEKINNVATPVIGHFKSLLL